jgi:hypothetical protein
MREYTHPLTDLKTLIGQESYQAYQQREQEQELLEAVALDNEPPPTCFFCSKPIEPNQSINLHHPLYKSNGGTKVEPAHESCHVEFHSRQGDYRGWGKLSSLTRAWAFNLKNVRNHPAYDFDRAYYLMLYAH